MLIYNGWRLLHDLLYVLSEKGYVVYNPKTKMGVYSLKFFFGYLNENDPKCIYSQNMYFTNRCSITYITNITKK